jgi:asparagine synthase (glutamine-hydrolysing)
MCGISGYVDLRGEGRVDEGVLQRMTDTLVHRGPDSKGHFIEQSVALGFRRLKIIDPSGGDQPLFSDDRNLVLTCNGEIYNYRHLREQMVSNGYRFRTNSDVEVLLPLYQRNKTEFLNQLNGQFAFAIYDRLDRILFLARDQFGICPLYYTVTDEFLIFASEMKAILEHPSVRRQVDLTGLDQVLTLPGAISPRTIFKGIQGLPSGHLLVVKNGTVSTKEYWDLDYPLADDVDTSVSEEVHCANLRGLLEASVRYRLQADVPVGFFLSGGLDSSLIAAMIQRIAPFVQRHSFSVNFSDNSISEAKYQRIMSRAVNSIHHEVLFDEAHIAERLGDVVYHSETPLKETYNTASLALSAQARQRGVTVVLNGEGSDEIFAGYVGYRFDKQRRGALKSYDLETIMGDEIRESLWGDQDLHYEKDEHSFRGVKESLYSRDLSERLDEFDCVYHPVVNKDRIHGRHPVHKRSYLDFKLRLAGHLIADHGDRMAMANSIEARYPFLDPHLVDYCRYIPPDMKLKGFIEKSILKKAAESFLPLEIIGREKFGFVAPGSPALLQKKLPWVSDLLSYDVIKKQGYFNPDTVQRLQERYATPGFALNPALEDDLLIVVLTFGLLQQKFNLPALN